MKFVPALLILLFRTGFISGVNEGLSRYSCISSNGRFFSCENKPTGNVDDRTKNLIKKTYLCYITLEWELTKKGAYPIYRIRRYLTASDDKEILKGLSKSNVFSRVKEDKSHGDMKKEIYIYEAWCTTNFCNGVPTVEDLKTVINKWIESNNNTEKIKTH